MDSEDQSYIYTQKWHYQRYIYVLDSAINTILLLIILNCLQALYDYQPSDNDVQPMKAWLAVMEVAHKNLAR